MTSSQFAAESLLRTYLSGRSMPRILRDAVVCVIEARLTNNETPTLDETLRMDIDNHAVATSLSGSGRLPGPEVRSCALQGCQAGLPRAPMPATGEEQRRKIEAAMEDVLRFDA